VFEKCLKGRKMRFMSIKRHELTDEQWQQLEALLPPEKPATGRQNLGHRQIINGILWVLKTGAPWRDMPERYGKWETVASRFYRWRKNGVWDRIFAQLQQIKDRDGAIDWQVHYVDGSVVRAHQHAAGAKKAAPKPKP
jgi:transposase